MKEQRPVPPPWAAAFVKAGATDRRTGDGQPVASFTKLAEMCGSTPWTLAEMAYGRRNTSQQTIRKVADALNLDVTKVAKWAGKTQTVAGEYRPPAEADRLTQRQRDALDELILSIVDAQPNQRAVGKLRALHPPKQAVDVDEPAERAARDELAFEGQRLQQEADMVGEQSQDPGRDDEGGV